MNKLQILPVVLLGVLSLVFSACGQSNSPVTPNATQTGSNQNSQTTALFVKIVQPDDESVSGDANITIKGQTLAGADASINGTAVVVDNSGNFSLPVTLIEGPNVFDITATDDNGDVVDSQLVVSYAP